MFYKLVDSRKFVTISFLFPGNRMLITQVRRVRWNGNCF